MRPKITRDRYTWMHPLEIIASLFLEFTTLDIYLPQTEFPKGGGWISTFCLSCKANIYGAAIWKRPKKPNYCHIRHDTMKISPCSKVISSENGDFCSPSLIMVTSPYQCNIFERHIQQYLHFIRNARLKSIRSSE